jgi:S-formylglutathione hydrolase FrmB
MIRLTSLFLVLVFSACGGSATATKSGKERSKKDGPSPAKIGEGFVTSSALGVKKRYRIFFPQNYETGTARYPVVYLLHGLGGNEDSWDKMGLLAVAKAEKLEAIVVMPDGDDGFYVNWATPTEDYDECRSGVAPFEPKAVMESYCVRQRDYESYLIDDLVPHIDNTYRTIPDRAKRAMAGVSMGGYGALYLAFKRPDLFGAAASHSGIVSLLYEGPYPYKKGKARLSRKPKKRIKDLGPDFGRHLGKAFGTDLKNWRSHDPTSMVTSIKKETPVLVYLDCGTEDEFQLQHANLYLSELLSAAGLVNELFLGPGKHDTTFFQSRIDDSVRFLKNFFNPSAPPN